MHGILQIEERKGVAPPSVEVIISKENLTKPLKVEDAFCAIFTPDRLNPHQLPGLEAKTASLARPAREKIAEIAKRADELIAEKNCTSDGLCPVKKSIYDELFAELIRQIALELPERGALLSSIKEEIDYSFGQHLELFQSSSALCAARLLSDDEELDSLQRQKEALTDENVRVHNQRQLLANDLENFLHFQAATQAKQEERLRAELQFLNEQNETFERFCKKKNQFGDLIELKKHHEAALNKL